PVAEDGAGFAVDLVQLQRAADPNERRECRGERAGDLHRPVDGPAPMGALAAAVPDDLHVGGEQFAQSVDITLVERVEEPPREPVPLAPARREPRAALVHVSPRSRVELAAGSL